jgi:hypothetical protein
VSFFHSHCRQLVPAVFAVCTAFQFGHVFASVHGRYDLKLPIRPTPSQGKSSTFNLDYLDLISGDFGHHAANYPPRLDSTPDHQRAQRDAASLTGLLDTGFSADARREMPLRMGTLGLYGHNLQIHSADAFADTRFAKLLAGNPDHPAGNYHYGQFLAGTGRAKEALPYLSKASDKGVTPAQYSIGIVYITLGDKPRANDSLTAYQRAQSADEPVGKLIQAIRDGKVVIKQGAGK